VPRSLARTARTLQPRPRLATASMVLEIVLGVGALFGGLALMAGPRGEILPLPLSALAGSPFASYLVPGAVLFTVLGLGSLGAVVLVWRRHRLAPLGAFATGAALLVWLMVQIAIVGYSNHPPLQALYVGLGVVMTSVALVWMGQGGRARAASS
jgi:hypothetical protein